MKRILVVDDSASVRQQVAFALTNGGFQVAEACDGLDALQKLTGNTAGIGLVICDINMPRMNGLEMVERVSQDASLRSIPILMLTSERQPSLIERAKKAGVKGWIVKPFKADLLVEAVKKLVA